MHAKAMPNNMQDVLQLSSLTLWERQHNQLLPNCYCDYYIVLLAIIHLPWFLYQLRTTSSMRTRRISKRTPHAIPITMPMMAPTDRPSLTAEKSENIKTCEKHEVCINMKQQAQHGARKFIETVCGLFFRPDNEIFDAAKIRYIPSESASLEEQNAVNFSSIAPSSEELRMSAEGNL